MRGTGKKPTRTASCKSTDSRISSSKFRQGCKISNGKNTKAKLISRKLLKRAHYPKASQKHPPIQRQADDVKKSSEDVEIKKLNRRTKKTNRRDNVVLDDALRLQRRTRYLLIKMKLEHNLIEAYSREGWKGQSREKIKPEKELQRAKKQILRCKLGIREAIRQLDLLSSVGSIADTVISPDGSVYHEHIFCAKCKLREAFPDNDIILCDGTCNCAFHQKCLDPPLDSENIPPDDQGWFCKFCESKMQIIEAINAHIGTHFEVDSNWQDIFKEEAAFPDDGTAILNPEEEWPSDDSEDGDYDPERRVDSCNISAAGTDDNKSDDDSISTSLSWSLDGEEFSEDGGLEKEGTEYGNHSVHIYVDSDGNTDGEILCGRRQRTAVDYNKLYDEMFGKDVPPHEQLSEDEDWGPAKRRRRKESDAASTLTTLCESEKKYNVDGAQVKDRDFPRQHIRRPCFRIPHNSIEKLRQAFAENELPSRDVRENLSKELGLHPEKVSKWFKNARYMALKARKAGRTNQLFSSDSKVSKEYKVGTMKDKASNVVETKNNPIDVELYNPNNLNKAHQEKFSKSIGDSIKKKQHKRDSLGSSKNSKMSWELSDDVSLSKLLKARTKKRVKGGVSSQQAEMEMERLCRIKNRVERLKQTLCRLQNRKINVVEPQQTIIYVPVAEVKEKVIS